MGSYRQLKTIVAKEIKVNLRSAWTYTFLILLFVFMLPIVFLHADHISSIGQYSKLTGTIMNLLLYFLPLMTLIISSFSITSEKEDDSLAFILTFPINGIIWTSGKLIGIIAVLLMINVLNLTVLGLLSLVSNTPLTLENYTFLALFSISITIVFASVGVLLGSIAKNRWQSLILSVSFWILFVLAWPILFITFLSTLHYSLVTMILQIATILNPAEIIRVFFTIKLGGGTIFGPEYLQWITWVEGIEGTIIFTFILIFSVALSILLSTFFIKVSVHD